MKNNDTQTFKIRDAASYDPVIEQFDYFTGRTSLPLAVRMITLAKLNQTESILDIGTGTGVVALEAAKAIGSNGTIYGIDLSEQMLAKAEEKAERLNLSQKIKFIKMDAENLDFENQKFDVVLSLFALLHFPNPLAALEEIFRVTKPGGRLVLAVGSGVPLFSPAGWLHILKKMPEMLQKLRGNQLVAPQFLDAMVEQYVPRRDEPEVTHLAEHHNQVQEVSALVKKAGFDVLQTDWHGHQEILDTPEDFWEIQSTFSSIARKRIAQASTAEAALLRQKFTEKCQQVQSRGGLLVYPSGAFYVVAHRPK